MSARYDIESLLSDIEAKLKATINTKLAEIDTEKNAGLAAEDQITLEQIPDDGYLTSLNGAEANFKACIHYGEVESTPEDVAGSSVAKRIVVEVAVLLPDAGDKYIMNRMYRYRRALEEIFEANWGRIGPGARLQVSSLAPITIRNLQTSARHKVVGVQLETVLV